jgi:hypothetical protein
MVTTTKEKNTMKQCSIKEIVLYAFSVMLIIGMWICGDMVLRADANLRARDAIHELDMLQQFPDRYVDKRKKELIGVRELNLQKADQLRQGFSYRTVKRIQRFLGGLENE